MLTRDLLNHNRGDIENWAYTRARTAFMGDSVLCKVINNFNMFIDPKNCDMSPWLALHGMWEAWITMAIGRAIQPGWTCIDGGAWCGYYTLLMADLVGPSGKVLSFEPSPFHYMCMLKSAMANGYSNVYGSPCAISDKDGKESFFLSEYGGGNAISVNTGNEVETYRLDNIESPVNFIKLDIEGGEERAWYGMQELLKRNPLCIVVMEWDSPRYKDINSLVDSVCQFAQPRIITTDGSTQLIDKEKLFEPEMRYLWLQK